MWTAIFLGRFRPFWTMKKLDLLDCIKASETSTVFALENVNWLSARLDIISTKTGK